MPAAQDLAEIMSSCPGLKLLATSRSPSRSAASRSTPCRPSRCPPRATECRAWMHCGGALRRGPVQRASGRRTPRLRATLFNADLGGGDRHAARRPAARDRACGRARKLLQPQAILPRLQKRLQLLTGGAQDLPGRQQTMRNAIDWSYGLLTPDEQQFFRKLSVFVGGWTWRPPRPCAPPATTRTRCSRA